MLQPKSVNMYYGALSVASFPNQGLPFDPMMHWTVKAWDMGTTAAGSSGSPLFDKDGRIVGGLSGGNSFCSNHAEDYFFSLNKIWNSANPGAEKVVSTLDPSGQKRRTCEGSESSTGNAPKFVRISHIDEQFNQKSLEKSLKQLSREQLLGTGYGTIRIQERYLLKRETEVSGVFIMFDTQAGTPSVSSPATPLELQVFIGDDRSTPALTQTLDISSVSQPMVNGSTEAPRFRELYVPFSQKVSMPEDGAIHFALNVSGLPEHMSVMNKDHTSDMNANTLYRHIGGKTISASGVTTQPLSATLWIDPVVYSKETEQQAADEPLITLAPLGSQVLLTFAPRVKGREARVAMYTLLGQRVYEHSMSAGTLVLNRNNFEGLGVLVLCAECGGEKMSMKVLFSNEKMR